MTGSFILEYRAVSGRWVPFTYRGESRRFPTREEAEEFAEKQRQRFPHYGREWLRLSELTPEREKFIERYGTLEPYAEAARAVKGIEEYGKGESNPHINLTAAVAKAKAEAEKIVGKQLTKLEYEVTPVPEGGQVEYTAHKEEEYVTEEGKRGWKRTPTAAKILLDPALLSDESRLRMVIAHEALEAEGVKQGAESHSIALKHQEAVAVRIKDEKKLNPLRPIEVSTLRRYFLKLAKRFNVDPATIDFDAYIYPEMPEAYTEAKVTVEGWFPQLKVEELAGQVEAAESESEALAEEYARAEVGVPVEEVERLERRLTDARRELSRLRRILTAREKEIEALKPLPGPPKPEVGFRPEDEAALRDRFLSELMTRGYSPSAARGHLPTFNVWLIDAKDEVEKMPRDEALAYATVELLDMVSYIARTTPPPPPPERVAVRGPAAVYPQPFETEEDFRRYLEDEVGIGFEDYKRLGAIGRDVMRAEYRRWKGGPY